MAHLNPISTSPGGSWSGPCTVQCVGRAHRTQRTQLTRAAALRGWLLLGALAVLVLLLAGLVHDFGRSGGAGTWFASRPELAGALLGIGFACMVGQRFLAARDR